MSITAMRLIGFILGLFLITLAVSMTIPMITLVVYERSGELSAFLWSSLITLISGLMLIMQGRPETLQLRPRDMYFLTTASWVVVCSFAARRSFSSWSSISLLADANASKSAVTAASSDASPFFTVASFAT